MGAMGSNDGADIQDALESNCKVRARCYIVGVLRLA